MKRLARLAVVAAVAIVVALLAGAGLLAGEAWWAARGAKSPDPPSAPDDLALGPLPADGIAAPVVVWLGDSTAAGVGASGLDATLPAQVARLLGASVRLTILARSGARVADVVRTQLPRLARLQPSQVFLSVGANDATHLTNRSRFRRDYDRLLASLPTSVTRVVLLGVPDMGGARRLLQPLRAVAGWRARALSSDIGHLARRRHAIYVDIAGGTGRAFRRQPGRYFASDRYHPNDAGYGLWAQVVVDTVRAQP